MKNFFCPRSDIRFLPYFLSFVFILTPSLAGAAQVSLAWARSTGSNVAGYKMHYGNYSGSYQYTVNVGNSTSCTISGLSEGTTYYFAATAYDTQQNESGYSNEVVNTVGKPAGTSDIFQPGPDWCRDYGPCPEGQGDCDGDAECQSGLICAQDVGADYGWPADRDVCERPAGTSDNFQPGPDWCRDYGPCPEGQGDCDGDAECQSGLICAQDVGADYGWPSNRDVCERPAGTSDNFQPGPDWCRDYGPCPEGQGDCDGDAECQSGLICAQDVGADYGWPSNRDVCERPAGTSDNFQPGPDWCRDYGPCPEGQGDCDGDAECQSGLICAQDVGADYGWPSNRDVCERPAGTSDNFQPGPDWCRDYGPCPEGQGDCDGDAECQSGLICAQDVGADYGWPSNRDVCERP